MKTGQVILVGAGPGDPGLLTIKGRHAIETAEVVVYDRLVSREILDLIPEQAERINVGKEAAHHMVPQEQINRILLEKALSGKRVVRLKGGDPFLFGRGGEELELLARHGVPFQEIPGITSAIAAPAYGGIPVTHRDFCSSVHIITGHRRAGQELEIPFEALVNTGGTLVFLMGVSALEQICTGLIRAGMAPDMPAAVVERGTTPAQRTMVSTISDLPRQARERLVGSPAVIVVGKVCALSEAFNWFDRLPLKGRPVIVTRPKDRAGTLCHRLRELGADVTEFPCIETAAAENSTQMEQAVKKIDEYEWLVFTSPAGVTTLMQMLRRTGRDVRALGRIRIAAIGPGTDRELGKYGLRADLIPSVYDGVHLGQALCREEPAGRVLILRAQMGTDALTQELRRCKIPYDDVRCYETRYPAAGSAEISEMLQSEPAPLVTFTSASTVTGFVKALGERDYSGVTAVCIGKQTEQEAKKYAMHTVTAAEATIDALIQRIMEC